MRVAFALLLLTAALTSGCINHNLPKDAYMRNVTHKISTPWGTSELQIGEAGTGTAANKAAGMKP